MQHILAVDIGGTFTDLVVCDVETGTVSYAKSPTTYDRFSDGIFDCFRKAGIGPSSASYIKHGTTLVINSLLQRTGARTALLTTRGFRDVLEIGRGNRTQPFNLRFRRDPPLVPRELRFEVSERMDPKGNPLEPLAVDQLDAIALELRTNGVEALAISFVNAYANPAHEERAAHRMRELLPDVFVSTGAELSREWYEFERSATVAANAYVGPQLGAYVDEFDRSLRTGGFKGSLFLMGSHGGVLSVDRVRREPIALVESGPVGGCIGAAAYAQVLELPSVIALDMGGTTAKCALVEAGRFAVESIYHIGGWDTGFPIRGNVIDIVEVGAGGGSIAWLDGQNRLQVGPRSAGSTPGPVCYRRGGMSPTVTDANLVLGRLDALHFLGGEMVLDAAGARDAIASTVATPLGFRGEGAVMQAASGILTLANIIMASAIKQISIARGRDPRDHVLFCYGGGGPLHAAELARELHIPRVIVPPEPGNFSAVGMLLADARLDAARTFLADFNAAASDRADTLYTELEAGSRSSLERDFGVRDLRFERQAELRYKGQKHSLKVDVPAGADTGVVQRRFNDEYRVRYGHANPKQPLEIVALHSIAILPIRRPALAELANDAAKRTPRPPRRRAVYWLDAGTMQDTSVYDRYSLAPGFSADGPAIIEEYGSSTLVGPRDRFTIGHLKEIRIDCSR